MGLILGSEQLAANVNPPSMNASGKRAPLKVAMLSLPPRTQSLLEFFFANAGRAAFMASPEDSAETAVFDVDTPASQAHWQAFHARTGRPGIALAVKPHEVPGALWVQKPVAPAALLAAATTLQAGGLQAARPTTVLPVPAAAPAPAAESKPAPSLINTTPAVPSHGTQPEALSSAVTPAAVTAAVPVTKPLVARAPAASSPAPVASTDGVDVLLDLPAAKAAGLADEPAADHSTVPPSTAVAAHLGSRRATDAAATPAAEDRLDHGGPVASTADDEMCRADTAVPSEAPAPGDTLPLAPSAAADAAMPRGLTDESTAPSAATIETRLDLPEPGAWSTPPTESPDRHAGGPGASITFRDLDDIAPPLPLGRSTAAAAASAVEAPAAAPRRGGIFAGWRRWVSGGNRNAAPAADARAPAVDDPGTLAEAPAAALSSLSTPSTLEPNEAPSTTPTTLMPAVEAAEMAPSAALRLEPQEPPTPVEPPAPVAAAVEPDTAVLEVSGNESVPAPAAPRSRFAENHRPLVDDALFGALGDLSEAELAQSPAVRYEPEQYLVGLMREAFLVSSKWQVPTQIRVAPGHIVLDAERNECHLDFDARGFDELASQPLVQRHKVLTVTAEDCSSFRETAAASGHSTGLRLDDLLWRAALCASAGRLPTRADATRTVYLLHWPNLTRLAAVPQAPRLAALWALRGGSILETARQLGIAQRHVIGFYNAAWALNLLTEDGSHVHRAQRKSARNRGLLSRLLGWLRR